MAKVRLTNKTMQVLNILCKDARTGNKTVQVLPKASVEIDRQDITAHVKRLETNGMVSLASVENTIMV
jgi:DNA-binding MarR family transcriptional regulator